MAEKRGGLAGRVGRRVTVEYSKNGTEWNEIPGLSNFNIAEGEAPSDTTAAFEGSFSTLGEAPIGDVTFTVVSYLPNHQAWRDIKAAKDNGDNLQFRITTPERTVFGPTTGGNTAAVADTGIVTIAGDDEAWEGSIIQRGMALEIGNAKYTIASIDLAADGSLNEVKVNEDDRPGSDVAAGVYSVLLPSLRWGPFAAGIKQTGASEGGVDTAIGSNLVVTPAAPLALPSIV